MFSYQQHKVFLLFLFIIIFFNLNYAIAAPFSGQTTFNGGSTSSSSTSSGTVTLYPNTRAPTNTDDAAHGNAVNQNWYLGGNQWQALAVGTSTAAWQILHPVGSPLCDSTTTPCKFAYGLYRLKSSYAGNSFRVTRASDSTQLAIGFMVNGFADFPTMDIFCKGTACTVDTVYDQSGNGFDGTQGTAINQPKILGNALAGNPSLRAITFDGYNGTRTLGNTAITFANRQNVSLLYVGTTLSGGGNNSGNAIFQFGNPTNALAFFNNPSGTYTLAYNSGSSVSCNTTLRAHYPTAYLWVATAGTLTIQQNNFVKTCSNTIASGAVTGIFVGSTSLIGWPMKGDALAFVGFDGALSAADQQIVMQSTYQTTGIQPQPDVDITLIGDSITCCDSLATSGTPPDYSYGSQLSKLLQRKANFYNMGRSAQLLSTEVADAATVAPLTFRAGALNIATIFGSTNDLAANATAAAVYANFQTICGTYKTAGFKCVIASPLPRDAGFSGGATQPSFETQRLALIALLQAGWTSFADGFIDVGSDPVMGNGLTAADNTALYLDKIHPTSPVGTGYLAQSYAKGLNTLLQ